MQSLLEIRQFRQAVDLGCSTPGCTKFTLNWSHFSSSSPLFGHDPLIVSRASSEGDGRHVTWSGAAPIVRGADQTDRHQRTKYNGRSTHRTARRRSCSFRKGDQYRPHKEKEQTCSDWRRLQLRHGSRGVDDRCAVGLRRSRGGLQIRVSIPNQYHPQ